MLPFDEYPGRGRELLGRPPAGTASSRTGYGLALQRITGQNRCAYCGVNLVEDYYRWLLLTVDHVVPAGEARRLGIPAKFSEDAINLVLACSGCNGYLNRYQCEGEPASNWSLEQLLSLRDEVFTHRFELIRVRREQELALFARQPWTGNLTPQTAQLSTPVDDLVVFTDNDAGYLAWLDANPAGLVVNTPRVPSPSYLILHRANCRTIGPQPSHGSRWTADYVKVCSTDLTALEDWAHREVGGEPKPCGTCRPLMS